MIIDFLNTHRSTNDLKTALEILREFKEGESKEEWMETPFIAWTKLEQLEEFLSYLVGEADLAEDTKKQIDADKQ